MFKMLLLCFSVIVLQLSFSSCIDMSCSHRDLSISRGNLLNERLGITQGTYTSAAACKRACQDSRKIIATCTAWDYRKLLDFTALDSLSTCNHYNGNIQYRAEPRSEGYQSGPVVQDQLSGPVFCPSETKANVGRATVKAGWVRLITCTNEKYRKRDLTCSYSKRVGISKSTGQSTSRSTGNSTSESTTAANEFSLTYGIEGGDPLGIVKQKFEASLSISSSRTSGQGFSWTSQSSNSATFTKSAFTTTTATFPVAPGSVASICQPVGYLDDFVVHANHFKIVARDNCD